MKSLKRIMGVVLTITLVAGLVLSALPASAGTLSYSTVTTPSGSGGVLLTGTSDVDVMAVAPDGVTVFAYDNAGTVASTTLTAAAAIGAVAITVGSTTNFPAAGTLTIGTETGITYAAVTATTFTGIPAAGAGSITVAHAAGQPIISTTASGKLYKSTNGGATFSSTNIGTGVEAATTVVAMAVSPNYATDSTLVIAVSAAGAVNNKVWRSTNGGTSFAEVNSAGLQAFFTATELITSIDITRYYLGGENAVLVGSREPAAAAFGSVYLVRLDDFVWTDLGAVAGFTASDTFAVKFSPNHSSDAQLMAVGATAVGGLGTIMQTKAAANNWSADVLQVDIDGSANSIDEASAAAATVGTLASAVIAFPTDYEWSSNNKVFVGITSNNVSLDDVYRVSGALPGGSASSTDLNANGSSTETQVWSLAVTGSYVGATVLVGQTASTTVKKTTDPSVSTVSWTSSTKGPTGAGNVVVALGKDYATKGTVIASTKGANSGVSISTDGAVIFNGASLLETSGVTSLRYKGVSVADANNIFLLVWDDVDAGNDIDVGEVQSVFRTSDGGATYSRVLINTATVAASGLSFIAASPAYATDSTVYVAENTTRIWKSTNKGDRWIGLAAPAAITAFTVVSGDTYFTGAAAAIYRSGRFNTTTDITTPVNSIAVSPNFATDDTVFVGTNDGDIYYSVNASATSGVKYTRLGADDELGDGNNVVVKPSPTYATDKLLFAGSDGLTTAATLGVFRWEVGGSNTTWKLLDAGTTVAPILALTATGIVVSPDGTLYVSTSTGAAGGVGGVRRSYNPYATTPTFEWMSNGFPAGAAARSLSYIPGSNVLYALIDSITAPGTTYPHGYAVTTFTDTFAVAPKLLGPADNSTTSKTTIEFTWEKIEAPSGITPTYTIEAAYDSSFANKVVIAAATVTTGTNYIAAGFTAGQQYYWRVYTAAGSPLASKRASGTFTVILGRPVIPVSDYNRDNVGLRPVLNWAPTDGATGYRVELAETAAMTGATSVLLEHTTWAVPADLKYSTNYYWRVKAISPKTESPWAEGIFRTMDKPVAPPAPPAPVPPVTITQAPPATIQTFTLPPPVTITIPPQPPPPPAITPSWIYAIIAIGAVLVIAVIVLIVRTRRVM